MEQQSDSENNARRPLKTRGKAWAQALARALARKRVSPNLISLSSIFFAVLGAACLFACLSVSIAWPFLIGTAVCIQLRLLVNMLDGMVAVEGGLGGVTGDIYNEFPDRIADACFLIPTAYVAASAAWPYGLELGWSACALALLTAYVRALGASIGAGHAFHGPMAKPHRMFLLTVTCLLAAVIDQTANVVYISLALMNLGMLITIGRRLLAIAHTLKHNA